MTDPTGNAASPADILSIAVDRDPSRIVLRLKGELDLNSTSILERALFDAESEAAGERQVMVDLGELEFIDSTGIRALVDAWQRDTERAGDPRFALVGAGGQVAQVLELSNLSSTLPFAD